MIWEIETDKDNKSKAGTNVYGLNPSRKGGYYNYDEKLNKILEIKEKVKISSNANTGCYVFNDIEQLLYYCKYVLDNKITFNGEPYTSCVIDQIIKVEDFFGYELNKENVFSLIVGG